MEEIIKTEKITCRWYGWCKDTCKNPYIIRTSVVMPDGKIRFGEFCVGDGIYAKYSTQ